MNQIELITGLPEWKWKPNSEKELELTGQQLVNISDFVWRVGSVAIAGFIHTSYTSPPWMWFLLAEGVRVKDLIDFRRLALKIPKGTLTAVAVDFKLGYRFARIYDFVETGEEVNDAGRVYKIMRKI
jgi:hypothetical protein